MLTENDGAAGRNLRLGAMGLGVAGSYFGYLLQRSFLGEEKREEKLKAAHTKAARRVREELQALRGPVMKIGQAMSLQTQMLPEEVLAELSQLQRKAPGMHSALVRVQFKNSVGLYPEDVFREFEPEPFAAASLGQVHRAVTKSGQAAAVKIQYPGIRRAMENDFKTLRALSKPAQASGHVTKGLIDEMETEILAETDYAREAANIEFFRERLKPLGFVRVPGLYKEHSTDKVLVMSLIPGKHLDDFLAQNPSQALRDKVGSRLFELFYHQILKVHAVHADPHWGNYLFSDEGEIGLVDFGCVKRLKPDFVAALSRMFLYPGRREEPGFQRFLTDWYDVCGAKLLPQTRKALTGFSERFYGKVYPRRDREDQAVDFGEPALINQFMDEARKLVRNKGLLAEYIFVSRAETGLYNTLHRLKARVHTSRILRKYLEEK